MSKNIAISKLQYTDVISVARSIGLKVVLQELEQGDELESLAFITLKGTAHQISVLNKTFA